MNIPYFSSGLVSEKKWPSQQQQALQISAKNLRWKKYWHHFSYFLDSFLGFYYFNPTLNNTLCSNDNNILNFLDMMDLTLCFWWFFTPIKTSFGGKYHSNSHIGKSLIVDVNHSSSHQQLITSGESDSGFCGRQV